jgi:hypothetical protein
VTNARIANGRGKEWTTRFGDWFVMNAV